MGDFEKLRSLIDVSIFESFPKTVSDELILQHAKDYLPQLRAVLLIKTGLIHHRVVSGNDCHSDIAIGVQQRCRELLYEMAQHVEANSLDLPLQSTSIGIQIQQKLLSDGALIRKGEMECDLTELQLCSSLFNVVHHLTINLYESKIIAGSHSSDS